MNKKDSSNITVSIKELFNSKDILTKIVKEKDIDIIVKYKLSKIYSNVLEVLKLYEELRLGVVKKN